MSESIAITFTDSMLEFVRMQTAEKGLKSEEVYIRELVQNEQTRKLREHLADLLDEGLQGEARELTENDWENLRQIAAGRPASN